MRLLFVVLFLILAAMPVAATPTTPTNTPRAHPLAPNPHTSVGLFWIYTDPVTGRMWTGGTYKVKRCAGAGCTPSTVVASGLTNADFQDTGLTANTTYGYRYLANDGSDSGDSPTVYVTTLAADSNFVQFPDSTWSNLLGPLPESAQIPFSWYNSVALSQGTEMIAKFPVVAPSKQLGTGSITNGTTTLTGSGTFFLEQVAANNPTCLDSISVDGVNAGAIASVNSNTSITLAATWNGGTKSNVVLTTNTPGLCGFGDPLSDYLVGNQLGYYDSPLAMWQVYFRTGDPQYMRGAIRFSESVFAGYMWLGRNRGWNQPSTTPNDDNMPAPRNFQFTGYLLLGAAGHNGVWDLLDSYLTSRYPTWISNYRGGNGDFLFLREKGYMILFTTQFVMAAPNSFPRSTGATTSLNGTVTVDGSLATGRKGHWRDQLNIDVPGFILSDQVPAGEWYESSTTGPAENTWPYPPGIEQPWLAGLVSDALGFCWRNTALSSTARDAARKMVLRSVAMMATRGFNTNVAADNPSLRWNEMWYFMGGGTILNPYAFEYGADSAILNNTPDNNMMAQYRQGNPFYLAPLGWAYEMSGQVIYKTWGDAIANAAFAQIGENTGGTGDGVKGLCDSDANYKDYGQCYRTSARYFANRLMSPASLGRPPVVTMPASQTLTGGINQVSLTASVACTNTPCTYKWYLVEYPLAMPRWTPMAVFSDSTALTTNLSGMESGIYKIGFYAFDSLGMAGTGLVNVTVGDGVFPPTVVIQKGGAGWECTTGTSMSSINVRAYSAAGRTLTHSFSVFRPNDAAAPVVTPSATTGNFISVSISGLTTTSSSWYVLRDVVTDSAGATRTAYFNISKSSNCGLFVQPSQAHNTIPTVSSPPDHVLPAGSTSTNLYVTPVDPEGVVNFVGGAAGYFENIDGGWVVGPLIHVWSQVAGNAATISSGNTLRPVITGLTAGSYTFRYSGTDQQGDTVTRDINVTVRATSTPKSILRGKASLRGRAVVIND